MHCFVYKSLRKADTYVFLRERDGFGALPPALGEPLGRLELVTEIELTPQRKLAREDAAVVIENLERRGFHLQLPPPEPSEPG
ncbi:YcgL domain-containing protein [Dokdonella soli]|uniref:YcgL domain-containing protein GCM10009105_11900 n=1 Tax=Dokdonella soli TaxID=529810 RepID=A0ABN1IEX1_9GAMM